MAKVVTECSGTPANDSERTAVGFLRDHLPDGWLIFHNFEIRQGEEVFEIDVAILAPHAVYLVDVKGTHGLIHVYGSKWYPEGRQQFHSPLAKLRNHAKSMATIIRENNSGLIELRRVHVHATVLLTADDASLNDPSGIDGPDVTDLKRCLRYFRDVNRIPGNRLADVRRFYPQIIKTITGKARPKKAALVFRDWQVEEKLGGTDRYTEYRAKHVRLGKTGGTARLRVYQADPYLEHSARDKEFRKISNAYRAVARMPSHANVLAVKDLFTNEDENEVVLVTEDLAGQSLHLHINKPALALTFDQKLQVIRDVLAALDHAHHYEVIHRNLTPDAIIVTKVGQSRLTGFDFARVGKSRTSTIADQIIEDLNQAYQAPECFRDPTQASIASDLYSAGVLFYQLLVGELPFENIDQMMEADGKFPIRPSEQKPDLPKGMDGWLQKFCEFDPEDRYPSAAVARKSLEDVILPENYESVPSAAVRMPVPDDLTDLPQDFVLADRFRIQKKLGSGGFGVAYKVFDSLGDVVRVIKFVTKDRRSVYERLRREYKTLTNLPEHPHVVKVIWADRLSDAKQTPYIVFEYVEGLDVSDLIDAEALSIDDSVRIVREAANGLGHLHRNGVYHQDVKPSNLLWTDRGVRIIDFNVAVSDKDDVQGGGGTRRYLPPDYDYSVDPTSADRIDRDLYALGITFYECLAGQYPFDKSSPPIKVLPKDVRHFERCSDLSASLADLLARMIAPERRSRFASADDLFSAVSAITTYRATPAQLSSRGHERGTVEQEKLSENTNPYVGQLLTLYSQSQTSNAGTRGLDRIGMSTYVPTYLDENLRPALLNGDFRLVIITGNAGDGKTAFIQQFEAYAERAGAQLKRGINGAVFQLNGLTYQSNYDGSQDEGDQQNDVVLDRFFAPFAGSNVSKWPSSGTRLIAINEGRLIDFFLEHENDFSHLFGHIQRGLKGGTPGGGIAVINLNLRSVVAESSGEGTSILERLVGRITDQKFWHACESCDIKNKCYVYHNVTTFQDSVAGPKVLQRLKMLYTIAHLRGRLHITMRDLRSALAFMFVGTRDCDEIHRLYRDGGEANQHRILNGLYFNSWMGGEDGSNDRLVSLLREIDVAEVSNPDLDRELGLLPPTDGASRYNLGKRADYDQQVLQILHRNLPRDYSTKNRNYLIRKHRTYVAYLRRRHFFERRDNRWRDMLPYKSIEHFLAAIERAGQKKTEDVTSILTAINRGEGLRNPALIGDNLALRVRQVERGTIRSYRLFEGGNFSLSTEHANKSHPFLEMFSPALILGYSPDSHRPATLRITLDIFEMLMRLNDGYRPSIEEEEGFYLSLAVFKNILSAAPYQDVLLTESGFDFYRIRRDLEGVLHLENVGRRFEA
jgi:serine/threonine protein kinase